MTREPKQARRPRGGGRRRLPAALFLLLIFPVPARAADADAVDVAAVYAVTGPAAEANGPTLRGVRLAVDEINRQGGARSKKINLLIFDNESAPIGSSKAARAAADAGAAAIVGCDWSSHSLAAARVAQDAGVPMISTYSTNPALTRIGDCIFRVCFTDDFQGKVTATFARRDLNASTAAVLVNVTSDYSLALAEIFRHHFRKLGGRTLLELEYKHRQRGFDALVRRANAAAADVMFIPGHDEAAVIATAAQDAGATSVFLGGDGWGTASFFFKGGDRLKRGYYSTHWSGRLDSASSRAFTEKYVNSELSAVNLALGYDAVMLLADAMRRAGSADRKKIRDALADTRDFRGVTGVINFNRRGDPVKNAVIMEIQDGRPEYLKTMAP